MTADSPESPDTAFKNYFPPAKGPQSRIVLHTAVGIDKSMRSKRLAMTLPPVTDGGPASFGPSLQLLT